jgi:hypothetical protein
MVDDGLSEVYCRVGLLLREGVGEGELALICHLVLSLVEDLLALLEEDYEVHFAVY